MDTTTNEGAHYECCDLHDNCVVAVTYWVDDKGRNVRHRVHDLGVDHSGRPITNRDPRNGTGSHSWSEQKAMPDHFVIYDGGDPLDRFVLRCACGFEATFFSYTAAARAMDGHLGLNFIPVAQRKVTAEQVSA